MKWELFPDNEEQAQVLRDLGFREDIYQCPCGSCDPEDCMSKEFPGFSLDEVEAWLDWYVWSRPEFDGPEALDQMDPHYRPCNCGSGIPWYRCPKNSDYCG